MLDALASRRPDVIVLTEAHTGVTPVESLQLSGHSVQAPDQNSHERWVFIWTHESIPLRPLKLQGGPEQSDAALMTLAASSPTIVFGSVLPWRTDSRNFTRAAAFERPLEIQSADPVRFRRLYPTARCWLLTDLNQEPDADGPVGNALGGRAHEWFSATPGLQAVAAGSGNRLRDRRWRGSIDHILLDQLRAAEASSDQEEFPLPGSPWPDHPGVELTAGPVYIRDMEPLPVPEGFSMHGWLLTHGRYLKQSECWLRRKMR